MHRSFGCKKIAVIIKAVLGVFERDLLINPALIAVFVP
jgi:hypothetical protein